MGQSQAIPSCMCIDYLRLLYINLSIASFSRPLSEDSFYVIIPGDILYNNLATSKVVENYAKWKLLDYSVDLMMGGALRPPIIICNFWRCEPAFTDFHLQYYIQWPQWSPAAEIHRRYTELYSANAKWVYLPFFWSFSCMPNLTVHEFSQLGY